MNRMRDSTKSRLVTKFNQLLEKQNDNFNPEWVKNLSNRILTRDETKVLAKGLNYATDHKKNDVLQFVAQIEPVIEEIRDISPQERNTVR